MESPQNLIKIMNWEGTRNVRIRDDRLIAKDGEYDSHVIDRSHIIDIYCITLHFKEASQNNSSSEVY